MYDFEIVFIMKAQNTYIVHPVTEAQASALKAFMEAHKIRFEESKENNGQPEFVAKAPKSEKQYNDDFVSIEEKGVFDLSETQKKMLDGRLKANKEDFIPAKKALNRLRQKYEL